MGFHGLGSIQDYLAVISHLILLQCYIFVRPPVVCFYLFIYFWHNPAARLLAATSLADDASSQHSSDQSDTRTEHSDEDVAEKTSKRGSTAKTTKKPATVKTEVHTHSPLLLLNQALMTLLLLLFSPLLASNQDGEEASKEKDYY